MCYNVGITYKDKFELRVVMNSSTGLILSNRFASKFRKIHDHSLSTEFGGAVAFVYKVSLQ